MNSSRGGRSVSILASLTMVLAGLGLGALPAEAASKGKIQVTVKAPKGVKAKVTVSKKGAKSFSVTKNSSKASVKKTRNVAAGTWTTKAQFVKKGNTYYVAKKTSSKVKKNKTKKVTVTFKKATVATGLKASPQSHNQMKLTFKAANKKYPVQIRYAEGNRAPKTVKDGKKITVKKGAKSATVSKLKKNTAYSFSLFTKVSGVWVGPVTANKIKTDAIERFNLEGLGVAPDSEVWSLSISADGNHVAYPLIFPYQVNGVLESNVQVLVHNRKDGATELASLAAGEWAPGNGSSMNPSLSADGRYIAFDSEADNLVGADTNGHGDIFVRDLLLGTTKRVSLSDNGGQANNFSAFPSLSADGKRVSFASWATNLTSHPLTATPNIFVRDLEQPGTELISVAADGEPGNRESRHSAISGDGSLVVFASQASNFVPSSTGSSNIFLREVDDHEYLRLTSVSSTNTPSNGSDIAPFISTDGCWISFSSTATNLDPAVTSSNPQIYVRNRCTETPTTTLVSKNDSGIPGDGDSWNSSISADGRYIAFDSTSANLAKGATSGSSNVYLHDMKTGKTILISASPSGKNANSGSYLPKISANGKHIAFWSDANNLTRDKSVTGSSVHVWSR